MNPRVASVQYQSSYKLILTFTNKEVKEFDFKKLPGISGIQGVNGRKLLQKSEGF